jgi:hypothetical protein
MGNGPDNFIGGLTFATIYNRIANLISINAGVLAIAQWAQAATEPHFRAWLGKAAQALPERFPGFPEEALASGAILDQVASEYHTKAVSAVNAAALVFGHTVTDTVIDELLEISARVVPERWRTDQEEFKVTLEELRQTSLEAYTHKALSRLVQRQKAKSLPVKVQYLFTISRCSPDAFGIQLDAELLGAADLARHAIVHGSSFTEPTERLHGMLDANLFAAQAAVFAVAQSGGYHYIIDHTGIVFKSTGATAIVEPERSPAETPVTEGGQN